MAKWLCGTWPTLGSPHETSRNTSATDVAGSAGPPNSSGTVSAPSPAAAYALTWS